MLTPKENYLVAAKGGKPEWVPAFPKDANFYVPSIWNADPVTKRDWMGVLYIEDPSGTMPDVIHPIMKNATVWRDLVRFPDLSKIDWEDEIKTFRSENYDPDKIDIAMIHSAGPFLLPINMLGWEEGLASIYEEPGEFKAFVDALTDFLVELTGYIAKYYNPAIMFSGDDISASTGPLISKQVWHEFYKDNFKRMVDAIHSYGALAEFHNCGNNQYLIEEFLGIGVDICQLPMPNEALLHDKERFGNRLAMTGGWDRIGVGAKPGATEEQVRQSARDAIDRYGKEGALIFWDGGIIMSSADARQRMEWLYDEVDKYGREVYR